MRFLRLLVIFAVTIICPLTANAATHHAKKHKAKTVAANVAVLSPNMEQPNLLSFGIGSFDIIKNTPRVETMDFRLEHRWGISLLPLVHSYFTSWNEWFQIHPYAGVETSTRGQFYGYGGFIFDVLLGRHVVVSPNIVVGIYDRGTGKRLGSFVEFRSTMEVGWRFNNEMRLTGYFGHISNAGLTGINPGAETAGLYFHVPTAMIFGG